MVFHTASSCMDRNFAGVEMNRKMLAEMAVNDAAAFAELVELAKTKVA